MKKANKKGKGKLEQVLETLAALKGEPLVGEVRKTVEAALSSSSNHVVGRAVALIGDQRDPDWRWEVEEIFSRFMDNPVKSDPGCGAKLAAVQALNKMECESTGVFTRAVRHVQMEPVFGGSGDTAAALRGHALAGLVAMGHSQSLFIGVPLLVDRQAETRYLAADALGYAATDAAELLLRMKALAGDEDVRVTGTCLSSLLRLDRERSFDFVAEFLDRSDTELKEAAALALAESHHREAFKVLEEHWHQTLDNSFREYLILPMSLIRNEASLAFLIEMVGHGNSRYAAAALDGLAIMKHDRDLVARTEQAVKATGNIDLRTAFQRLFH